MMRMNTGKYLCSELFLRAFKMKAYEQRLLHFVLTINSLTDG
jgi:hypothetical protein